MRAIILTLPFLLSACVSTEDLGYIRVSDDNPVATAVNFIGYTEYTHRAELREFIGVDPVRTEWCAAFVNSVLEESNIRSNKDHKYPLTARAFLDWGVRVNSQDIEPGDVVVFPRGNQGWQGHVGFYIRSVEVNGVEYYYILGGNQSNKVSIEMYPARKALGIRRQTPI
jgi:uncharacterized protein (TIGR02594 family)